jgi:hypothetical protein
MCKRALADQRKHEGERLEAALRDQQRQIMRRSARPPSLIEKFLQTKWGDYFTVRSSGGHVNSCVEGQQIHGLTCLLCSVQQTLSAILIQTCTTHEYQPRYPDRASASLMTCRACCAATSQSTTSEPHVLSAIVRWQLSPAPPPPLLFCKG